MKIVYFLYHLRDEDTDDEDIKLIGIYTDRDLAIKAKERVINKSGFADYPGGFRIISIELDRDSWVEGITTRPGRG